MITEIQQGFQKVIDLHNWAPQQKFQEICAQIEQEKAILTQTHGSSSLPSLQRSAPVRAVVVRNEKCLFGKFVDGATLPPKPKGLGFRVVNMMKIFSFLTKDLQRTKKKSRNTYHQ
jgi:hypothetical protein